MSAGVSLAVMGALYALSGGSLLTLQPGSTGTGEMLLLGCAACWVAYTLLGRMVLTTVDALTTTTVTSAIGAVLLLLVSLTLEGAAAWGSLTDAPSAAWFSIAALALGATALAYAWYLNGVKMLGAGTAAAYMSLVPLFGLVFSGLWLGETLTASLLVGGAMAILGMLLINLGRLRMVRFPAVENESNLK